MTLNFGVIKACEFSSITDVKSLLGEISCCGRITVNRLKLSSLFQKFTHLVDKGCQTLSTIGTKSCNTRSVGNLLYVYIFLKSRLEILVVLWKITVGEKNKIN